MCAENHLRFVRLSLLHIGKKQIFSFGVKQNIIPIEKSFHTMNKEASHSLHCALACVGDL
jgi:hypothetical protein